MNVGVDDGPHPAGFFAQIKLSQSVNRLMASSQMLISRRRHGFSILEVLIVLGIVILLLSLILPALVSIREQSRQARCKNSLKQVALALHNYESLCRVLPPGWIGVTNGSADPLGESGFGWGSLLLPCLDFQGVYSRTNFEKPIDASVNLGTTQTKISVYSCSSSVSEYVLQLDRNQTSFPLPVSDYVAVFGDQSLDGCDPTGEPNLINADGECRGTGAFYHNSKVHFTDFLDGMSTTFVIGERALDWESPLAQGTWIGTLPEVPGSVKHLLGSTTGINDATGPPDAFGSQHPGGAMFASGEGSVRFVSEQIDSQTFRALGTIRGRDPVIDF